MIIDVPIRDEKGNIKLTMTLNDAQHQSILQFGLNFLMATGMASAYGIAMPDPEDKQMPLEFDD